MKKFSELFKKYRLRAEFETIAAFGNALSEKGYHYEESIFSHWQKGTRTPQNRTVLLKLLEIFIERKAITTIDQANEFLASAGLGYLTEKEIQQLNLKGATHSPFQVPSEIADFTGRQDLLDLIKNEKIQNRVIHIYGSAGVGKTTFAIKIAHLLRHDFSDGVLWYRMGNVSLKEIFISIGHLFNQQLPSSNNIEVLASFIRSFLSQKKILLILDDVEIKSNIHLLIPISATVIILSRQKNIYIPADVIKLPLGSFSKQESLSLFENVLGKNYVKKYKNDLLRLSKSVGDLPLAVHIFTKQLQQSKILPKELFTLVEKEELSLSNLSYENNNLYLAINISYKSLSQKAQAVFLSLGVFEGKDFSIEAIGHMNGMVKEKTKIILDELHNTSLIETSIENKFRIHPMVKKFIGEKLNNPYISLLNKVSVVAFIIFTIYWIVLQLTTNSDNFARHIFSSLYFIVALWGAVWGIKVANKWGGTKNTMGKAILFFAVGLFLQVFGQISYAYYSLFENITIPYPSLGDIGYVFTIPVYIIAVFFLAKISGVKIGLHSLKNHLTSLILCVGILAICLLLLLQHYVFIWTNPFKIFLDFIYPIGDWIYVCFAFMIYLELKRMKKNIIKNKILFFVIALFMQSFSDFVFVYQANLQTWENGNINDFMYLTSYLLMTLSILQLNSHMSRAIKK